jgi:hypothetical protein
VKRLLVALLSVAALVAVGLLIWLSRGPPPEAPPRPPPRLPPLNFVQSTPAAKVELKIDPQIAVDPYLADRLYHDGVAELTGFARQAQEDQARLAAKGLPVRPYQRSIAWSMAAQTHRVISLKQLWFDDTGGAHPNHGSKGLLWDPHNDREIAREELFKPGADQGRLDGLLCRAIQAEKARRQGAVFDPQTWPCPKWADSDFVLAPSATPGKLGGLIFLFDPYAIGPYVEGDWALLVPQTDFRAELAPAWSREFAGQPKG